MSIRERPSDAFTDALRAELVAYAESHARRPRRRSLIVGGTLAALLVAGGTAAYGTWDVLPGAEKTAPIGAMHTMEHSGSGTLELGAPPASADRISVSFTCLSVGVFDFGSAGSARCDDADIGAVTGFELPARDARVRITADPDASWRMTATFVGAQKTPWARNARGLTYGVIDNDGSPDLIAVVADDGRDGYVYARQLAEADGDAVARGFRSPTDALAWQEKVAGTVVRVPVYESDGETQVGEFTVRR